MRIAYCIPSIYNSGGMERILSVKTSWLAEHGHEVFVITTDNKNRKPFFHFHPLIQFIDLGINYSDSIHNFASKVLKSPGLLLRHKRKLTHTLKALKADITISMFNAETAFLWKIGDGSRKIVEIHFARSFRLQTGRGVWKLYNYLRSMSDIRSVKKYDKFIVLSNADAAD